MLAYLRHGSINPGEASNSSYLNQFSHFWTPGTYGRWETHFVIKTIRFNPKQGFPVAQNLFYRCKLCGETIPSQPPDSMGCQCRNITIDIDDAHISGKQETAIELLED